jgi:hypothetical protein
MSVNTHSQLDCVIGGALVLRKGPIPGLHPGHNLLMSVLPCDEAFAISGIHVQVYARQFK